MSAYTDSSHLGGNDGAVSNYPFSSNGNGFAAIDVGNFTATLIQAADGEFVSFKRQLSLGDFYMESLNFPARQTICCGRTRDCVFPSEWRVGKLPGS